jgi:uncharacterized protein GlcG (DUF336 family)
VRAVVDAGAHLIASLRMVGAWLGSIEIAQNKAYTARAFDMTTKDLAKISQPRQPASGIAVNTQHRVAIFLGGIPLKAGDWVIGASGGNPIRITQERPSCAAERAGPFRCPASMAVSSIKSRLAP